MYNPNNLLGNQNTILTLKYNHSMKVIHPDQTYSYDEQTEYSC